MKKRHINSGIRKICTHPRRQWAACEHPWHFSFKWKDVHHRFSLDKHVGEHVDSKTKAEELAGDLKQAIRAGTFGTPTPVSDMTVRQLIDLYIERVVVPDHPTTAQAYRWSLNAIAATVLPSPTGGSAPLGDWRLTDVVTDTILRFREVRRAQGTGVVGTNRHLALLRVLFNWGIVAGYLDSTPFLRSAKVVVKLAKEPSRTRRLRDGEETALLSQCSPHLRAVVTAAIDSGMRRAEVLSLQWREIEGMHVQQVKGQWTISWGAHAQFAVSKLKTKTKEDRKIPISTRLKGILEMRALDPNGEPLPLDGYVFGSEIGTRILSIKRAWATAVLKSHGYKPTLTATANLSAASRAALDQIDLNLHDLRRECGSRWMDAGVPLATIQRWLGHANISQTSTYLAGVTTTEHDHMKRFEERQAALQRLATVVRSGGKTKARTAARGHRKPNKTAVNHDTPIM